MTAWVETYFPWFVYEDEDLEDWSILDKKELVEKKEFKKRYAPLQDWPSNVHLVVDQEPSKVIFMYRGRETASV